MKFITRCLNKSVLRLSLAVVVALFASLAISGDTSRADVQYGAFMGGGGRGISVEVFRPSVIFVNAGDTVRWSNPYDEGHTVSFLVGRPGPGPVAAPNPIGSNPTSFDGTAQISSGILNKDGIYTVTFSTPGAYPFICLRHQSQTGLVQVLPAGVHVPDQAQRDREAAVLLEQGISAGVAAAAAVPAPAKSTNADGSTTWSIPNSPVVDLPNGQANVMQFLPARLQISAGDSVEWNDSTPTPHTVTFTAGGPPRAPGDIVKPVGGYDGSTYVNSGMMGTAAQFTGGTKFALTFTKAGTYSYICILHASQGMAGVIEVVAPSTVRPPATGDGGLVASEGSASHGRWLVLVSLGLVAASMLGGSFVLLRHRR